VQPQSKSSYQICSFDLITNVVFLEQLIIESAQQQSRIMGKYNVQLLSMYMLRTCGVNCSTTNVDNNCFTKVSRTAYALKCE